MSNIVKYHNDLNKLAINSLGSLEQNLLYKILFELKDKRQETLEIHLWQIKKIVNREITDKEAGILLQNVLDKVFKLDYSIIMPEINAKKIINLFDNMTIFYNEPERKNIVRAKLTINSSFEYLLNNVFGNFTSFELTEFLAIHSKYSKTLYRLLKEKKLLGKLELEWNEFKRILCIPEKMLASDIDKRILKPAIKELTKIRNLFQYSFKNLSYKKTYKGIEGKKGGKVIDLIIFSFVPEKMPEKSDNAILHNAKAKIQAKGKKVVMDIQNKFS